LEKLKLSWEEVDDEMKWLMLQTEFSLALKAWENAEGRKAGVAAARGVDGAISPVPAVSPENFPKPEELREVVRLTEERCAGF